MMEHVPCARSDHPDQASIAGYVTGDATSSSLLATSMVDAPDPYRQAAREPS
jgi:hypothetical protein